MLFFVLAFSLALLNRTPGDSGVEAAGRQSGTEAGSDWFMENEAAPDGVQLDAAPEAGAGSSGETAPAAGSTAE